MAFRISPTAFQFSSTAFHFPRNLRKSIYGEKYTKDCYLSFIFSATCSPSFVVPAKQYLRLTQHKHFVHCNAESLREGKAFVVVLLVMQERFLSLFSSFVDTPSIVWVYSLVRVSSGLYSSHKTASASVLWIPLMYIVWGAHFPTVRTAISKLCWKLSIFCEILVVSIDFEGLLPQHSLEFL